MPGNVLTGIVRITAPGVEETFKKIGAGVTATEGKLKQLNAPISKLGDTLETLKAKAGARRSFLNVEQDVGKIAILNKEIGALDAEILRIGNIGKAGFDQFGVAIQKTVTPLGQAANAGKGFLATMMRWAYILPGIGIAGLIGGLADLVAGLFSASKAFSDAEIKASLFKDALEDIKTASDNLKGFLDLQNKLKSIDFKIKFGPGVAADINDLNNELLSNQKIIADSEKTFDKLDGRFNELTQGVEGFIKSAQKLKGFKLSAGAQILTAGKDIGRISTEEIKKLSKDQQAYVVEYQATQKALNDADKTRSETLDRNRIIQKEILLKNADEQRRVLGLSKGEYERYVNETISSASKLANAFKNTIDLKLDLTALDSKEQTFQKSLDFLSKFKTQDFKVVIDPELKLSEQEVKDQQDLIERELANLQFDVKGIKTKPIPIEPQFSIETGFVKQEIEKKFKDFNKLFFGENSTFSKLFPSDKEFKISATPSFQLTPGAIANAEALKAMQDAANTLTETFNTVIAQGLAESFSAIGEGLGNILSGEDFGTQIFEAIGGLLQNLGKALIQFGVIKKFIDKLLENPFFESGFAVIAVGIAAVAIGTAIKNIKGTKTRAKGGPVTQGDDYLVGEEGPEIFRPNKSGTIIPHRRTKNLLAGARLLGGSVMAGARYLVGEGGTELFRPNTGQGIQSPQGYTGNGVSNGGITVKIIGQFVQRGQDMVATIALANQSNARLT